MDFICPYTCSYRTSSGYCGSTGGWERCRYIQLHQPNTVVGYVPPLKKTNADKIRAMTDDELAEFIGDDPVHDICPNDCFEDPDRPCKVCVLKWLK